jgi:hypothetical protein
MRSAVLHSICVSFTQVKTQKREQLLQHSLAMIYTSRRMYHYPRRFKPRFRNWENRHAHLSARSRNASGSRSVETKCASTVTERMTRDQQKRNESTGTPFRFRLSSNQLDYKNTLPLTIPIRSKMNTAKTKKRRTQERTL